MKILMVNAFDIDGGAARAAYRLHRALLDQDIDSQMLVQKKSSDDYTVIASDTKIQKVMMAMKIRSKLDSLPLKIYQNRTKTHFSTAWFPLSDIVDKINEINPDIVHFHWINNGMIRIEDLLKINAPIVWSLHDNWAFTGGCHIMWECEKYKDKCGACPRLGSKKENDLSRKIFNRKQKTFSKVKNMTIVGLSRWLNNCSLNSTLLKGRRHVNLPNPIDTNIFKPFDKQTSRELWNLSNNKKLILFGAMNATSDINKGFQLLKDAISQIEHQNIELVVFGNNEPKESQKFGFKTHYVGNLHDDISLVTLYSAVDVMIVPSIQENLSNTIMESLACGTPVVGFDIGGNSDLIEHQNNGYLVKPFDTFDLANGIEWILNASNYEVLCLNAKDKILQEFDNAIVVNKYVKLYEEILNA